MVGVATELQYVPLGDAQMFKELPCGVSRSIRCHGAKVGGKPRDGVVKVQMRICSGE